MNDRKLKVYLDTSVVSYLQQEDVPDRMAETLKLWKKFMTGCYDIYLSSMTTYEIDNCSESKKNFLHSKLDEIEYTELEIDKDCLSLARDIIATGILTEKSFEDSQHIAVAVLNKCDVIVSWNFKHLVNIKTINGVRAITNLQGYSSIDIVSPEMMFQEAEDE